MLFTSGVLQFLIFVLTLVLLIANYFNKCYEYWTIKGVPTVPPKIPFGNSTPSLQKSFTIGILTKTFYDYLKERRHKYGGVYLITKPNLVVLDPDLIKSIMCKEFRNFVDRGFYSNPKFDPISGNLFTLSGNDWRNLRVKLSATFTSNKMKTMFQTMVDCSNYYLEYLGNSSNQEVDIKEVTERFTVDVIGSCAFGIDCNSFKYPNAEFRLMAKKIFEFNFLRSLRAAVIVNAPKIAFNLGLTMNNKNVRDFFIKIVKDTIKLRKENNYKKNDFLQILIDLEDVLSLTVDEIAAQVFLFFVAGFGTSSTSVSFALFELGKRPDIQERVRKEVCEVVAKDNNQFTYDNLNKMSYLSQVFDETLRLWPPGITLNRRCTEDYIIPDANVTIEKGTPVLIPVYGLHRDPDYYPKPETFDPDRFSDEQKQRRHPAVYLPFGDGPRNCIGKRFGLMQSKLAVARVIKDFRVSVGPETKEIEIDPCRFVLTPINPIYLRLEKV